MSIDVDRRRYKGQALGLLPDRILDELTSGPMTAAGLAVFLRANERSVNRALYRLRDRGLVVSFRFHQNEPNVWRRAPQ